MSRIALCLVALLIVLAMAGQPQHLYKPSLAWCASEPTKSRRPARHNSSWGSTAAPTQIPTTGGQHRLGWAKQVCVVVLLCSATTDQIAGDVKSGIHQLSDLRVRAYVSYVWRRPGHQRASRFRARARVLMPKAVVLTHMVALTYENKS